MVWCGVWGGSGEGVRGAGAPAPLCFSWGGKKCARTFFSSTRQPGPRETGEPKKFQAWWAKKEVIFTTLGSLLVECWCTFGVPAILCEPKRPGWGGKRQGRQRKQNSKLGAGRTRFSNGSGNKSGDSLPGSRNRKSQRVRHYMMSRNVDKTATATQPKTRTLDTIEELVLWSPVGRLEDVLLKHKLELGEKSLCLSKTRKFLVRVRGRH